VDNLNAHHQHVFSVPYASKAVTKNKKCHEARFAVVHRMRIGFASVSIRGAIHLPGGIQELIAGSSDSFKCAAPARWMAFSPCSLALCGSSNSFSDYMNLGRGQRLRHLLNKGLNGP
jgi:hypothetical protein